jgi:hypothetical protein
MERLDWLIVALALLEGSWLAFDGAHALITGDYVTPKTGRYAGQLGSWANVVSAVGIPPRSALMIGIHLTQGAAWLAVTFCFILGFSWGRTGMLVCAVLGLWYVPLGTLLSSTQVILLLVRK